MNMKLEYDQEVDAAYIYIDKKTEQNKIKETLSLNEDIILDFDCYKKLIGIEVLNASKHLRKNILQESIIQI